MSARIAKSSSIPEISGHRFSYLDYYHSGEEWLACLHVLMDNRDERHRGLFTVEPFMLSMSLELLAKAHAAQCDSEFDAKSYRHATSRVIEDYKDRVPTFDSISSDTDLMALIKEYEKTVDARYGEMYMSLSGPETERLIDAAHEMYAAISGTKDLTIRSAEEKQKIWLDNFRDRQRSGMPIDDAFFKDTAANNNRDWLHIEPPIRVSDINAQLLLRMYEDNYWTPKLRREVLDYLRDDLSDDICNWLFDPRHGRPFNPVNKKYKIAGLFRRCREPRDVALAVARAANAVGRSTEEPLNAAGLTR
ncbi:hypothetical protein [Nocardia sp. R7R-8]|uniref:hypothetical protein n=1 Tax=Nocardia sp. R7R-8 TaxID=3459304 RepID=UPI00403DF1DF